VVDEFEIHFEWDPLKAESNVVKHGVPFGVAATVLRDPLAVTVFDADHSAADAERWVTIGMASSGACLVVIHTWEDIGKNSARVRLISARKATKKERVAREGR
jgi:uncharacterized DUF497 family protein